MEAASRNSIGEGLSEFRKRVLLSPAAVLQAAVVDESVAVASPIYPHILLVARRSSVFPNGQSTIDFKTSVNEESSCSSERVRVRYL